MQAPAEGNKLLLEWLAGTRGFFITDLAEAVIGCIRFFPPVAAWEFDKSESESTSWLEFASKINQTKVSLSFVIIDGKVFGNKKIFYKVFLKAFLQPKIYQKHA